MAYFQLFGTRGAGCELVDDMLSHLKADYADCEPASQVANFYVNRSVFITGATGFIGKMLAEKLVRSCKGIKRVYLLIREKRGQDVNERLADLMQTQIFNRLKSSAKGRRELEEKLRAVKGDITLPNFGIAESDMAELRDEISIVFNSAATIRFSEPIEVAARNNISSVSQLVAFCERLTNLRALVHLSTAYSNCYKRDTIQEVFYEPAMRGSQLLASIDTLKRLQASARDCFGAAGSEERASDLSVTPESVRNQPRSFHKARCAAADEPAGDLVEQFTEMALRRSNHPNTYTFTKSIAESHLLELTSERGRAAKIGASGAAVAVVRPSIVAGSWREPEVGMIDNYNGPTGVILALYTGALQAMPGHGRNVADLVPVDMTVNMLICVGWFLAQRAEAAGSDAPPPADGAAPKPDKGAYVFNYVSGFRNPLRWHQVTDMIARLAYRYPSRFTVRLPGSHFVSPDARFYLYDLLNHWLPARLADWLASSTGAAAKRRRSALAGYLRLKKMTDTLTPFTSNQWRMSDANVLGLLGKLSAADLRLFPCDVAQIEWASYIRNYIIGARIYTLKDEPRSVVEALRRLKKRQLLGKAWPLLLVLLVAYLLSPQLGQLVPDAWSALRL